MVCHIRNVIFVLSRIFVSRVIHMNKHLEAHQNFNSIHYNEMNSRNFAVQSIFEF